MRTVMVPDENGVSGLHLPGSFRPTVIFPKRHCNATIGAAHRRSATSCLESPSKRQASRDDWE